LRRAWTKFSLRTSLAFFLTPFLALAGAAALAQDDGTFRRANELTLAGLRPGRDTLAIALKRYKAKYAANSDSGDSTAAKGAMQWRDSCTGRQIMMEVDEHGVIQQVTISALGPKDGKCVAGRFDALDMKDWFTGRGLSLGDPRNRVTEMYGEPNSDGPSVKGAVELEYLHYSFDWAGDDTPQALEIDCARDTGRVLEITLAFPSLKSGAVVSR
jgi:hypothetical protein